MAKTLWETIASFNHPYEAIIFVSFVWLMVNFDSSSIYLVYGVILLMSYVFVWQSQGLPKFAYISPVSGLYSFLGLKKEENAITRWFRSPTTMVGVTVAWAICLVTAMTTSSYFTFLVQGRTIVALRFIPTGLHLLVNQAFLVTPFETLTFQVFFPLALERWFDEARYGKEALATENFPFGKSSFIAALLISQAVFAATHWDAYGGNDSAVKLQVVLGAMLLIFVVGIIWAVMARAYSPAAAMGAHLGYNMVFLHIVGAAPVAQQAILSIIHSIGVC